MGGFALSCPVLLPQALIPQAADPGESTILYETNPEVAARLLAQLEADVENGRSTDGPDADNDFGKIKFWKSGK